MTEILLQKIEDRVLLLLAEITNLRQEVKILRKENAELKMGYGDNEGKLQELLSLLDVLEQDRYQETLNLEGAQEPMI